MKRWALKCRCTMLYDWRADALAERKREDSTKETVRRIEHTQRGGRTGEKKRNRSRAGLFQMHTRGGGRGEERKEQSSIAVARDRSIDRQMMNCEYQRMRAWDDCVQWYPMAS